MPFYSKLFLALLLYAALGTHGSLQANILLNTAPMGLAAPSWDAPAQQKASSRSAGFLARRLHRKLRKLQAKFGQSQADECAKIVLKTGEVIEATILEITTKVVRYQRCGRSDDPQMMLTKAEILSVVASDGGFLYRNLEAQSTTSDFDESSGPLRGSKIDSLAVTSMTGGILSIIIGLLPIASAILGLLALFLAAMAIILGGISLSRIKRMRGKLRGRGMAIAGIITGGVFLFLVVLLVAAIL